MTGTEQLQEFTIEIADAIREKTGTTESINPQDFAARISSISGTSNGANVQAVDTGDVLDDVNIEYATKTYVDGLVGDINSILESIINGGVTLIAFTVGVNIYQAEEGMTWEQFVSSKYNNGDITITAPYVVYSQQAIALNGSMVESTDIIISNTRYGFIV